QRPAGKGRRSIQLSGGGGRDSATTHAAAAHGSSAGAKTGRGGGAQSEPGTLFPHRTQLDGGWRTDDRRGESLPTLVSGVGLGVTRLEHQQMVLRHECRLRKPYLAGGGLGHEFIRIE